MALLLRVFFVIKLMLIFMIEENFAAKTKYERPIFSVTLPENRHVKKLLGYHPDSMMNFTERTEKYGYPSTHYTVTTEDGYIITVFRMLKKPECKVLRGPPVLFGHGILVSAMSWIDAGPRSGLAYLLADKCYDVWLANFRGTMYSKKHLTLDPDKDAEFWQFSFHEIGMYDIPAIIDKILEVTGSKNVNYINHSAGGGAFFALGSDKPKYLTKIRSVLAMSPATWLYHIRIPFIRFLASRRQDVYDLLVGAGIEEVVSVRSIFQELTNFLCHSKTGARMLCMSAISFFDGYHKDSISTNTMRVLGSSFPDGLSTKMLYHLAQLIGTNTFRHYDYGYEKNVKLYKSKIPPDYNLKNIDIPIVLIYSLNDRLVDYRDVKELSKHLPNLVDMIEIENPNWNHFDYAVSRHIPKYLLPKVLQYLEKFSDPLNK